MIFAVCPGFPDIFPCLKSIQGLQFFLVYAFDFGNTDLSLEFIIFVDRMWSKCNITGGMRSFSNEPIENIIRSRTNREEKQIWI